MRPAFAIAPDFHLLAGWSDRLLVAEVAGWRGPREDEIAGFVTQGWQTGGAALLFTVPVHMRRRFWDMLGEEAAEGTGDFVAFANDVRQFLDFKALPPPTDAVFDLVVQDTGATVDVTGLWAVVNFGEEPLLLEWPAVRLRLDPGEGCRIDPASPPAVVPTDEPNVMMAIRRGGADGSPDRLNS
jgi:hypothetical protein